MTEYFVGIDVGTGSVRAALITHEGKTINIANHPTDTYNPRQEFYEQSSNNIWDSVCRVVKVSFFFFTIFEKIGITREEKFLFTESCC